MDRFIEFKKDVSLDDLKEVISVNNSEVMILRLSKLTGTVKVRFPATTGRREIKRAFLPHKVKKIYTEFPVNKMADFSLEVL